MVGSRSGSHLEQITILYICVSLGRYLCQPGRALCLGSLSRCRFRFRPHGCFHVNQRPSLDGPRPLPSRPRPRSEPVSRLQSSVPNELPRPRPRPPPHPDATLCLSPRSNHSQSGGGSPFPYPPFSRPTHCFPPSQRWWPRYYGPLRSLPRYALQIHLATLLLFPPPFALPPPP